MRSRPACPISNTSYVSASLSEAQLLACADYLLDGLYHPMILTDARGLMREGYRYELADALELADAEALRGVAEKYLAEPAISSSGLYVSAPGELEAKNAEEEARLVQMKEEMSDEEIEVLVARTQDFYEWTAVSAEKSMINAVKVVDAQELPEELVRYEAEECVQDGVRVIRADVDCDDLVEGTLFFTADHIPYAQYNVPDTYISMLGSLNTQNYTTDALQTASQQISNSVSVSRYSLNIEGVGVRPVIAVNWSCLPENLDACYELAHELIWNSDPSDVDHARMAAVESNQMFAMVNSMVPSAPLLKLLPCYMNDAIRFDARLQNKKRTWLPSTGDHMHLCPHRPEQRPTRRSSCTDQCSSIQA